MRKQFGEDVAFGKSGIFVGLVVVALSAIAVKPHRPAIDECCIGLPFCCCELPLEFLRQPDVVLIEKRYPLALREIDGALSGPSEDNLYIGTEVTDAPVARALNNVSAPVGRAVVPNNQLPVGKRLREYRIDRFGHSCLAVVEIDDDRNPRHFCRQYR